MIKFIKKWVQVVYEYDILLITGSLILIHSYLYSYCRQYDFELDLGYQDVDWVCTNSREWFFIGGAMVIGGLYLLIRKIFINKK